jgi:hypothetical protein
MNAGYFLVESSNNEHYLLYDYKFNLIYSDVVNYDIVNKNTSYILINLSSGDKKAYVLDKTISLNSDSNYSETQNENYTEYINQCTTKNYWEPYSHGDNWKVGQSYFVSHSRHVTFEFI